MRKILFLSTTRSDYGLISPIIKKIKKDKKLKYYLVITSSHTNKNFGNTVKEIIKDKIKINKIIRCNYKNKNSSANLKNIADGLDKIINQIKPNIVFLPGDRYEMLSAAHVALLRNIPIFHYAGGQLTEGAWDNAVRHAVTKIANIHFVSTNQCKKRLISMGEQPKNIFVTGSIGVEKLIYKKYISKNELEKKINFQIDNKTILVTYHPETLNPEKGLNNLKHLITTLKYFKDIRVIFTSPNHDYGYFEIQKNIKSFVKKNSNRSIYIESLGREVFLSTLNHVSLIIGNSSSGIIEAPSFNLKCINIGDRQKGRYFSDNIYNSKGNVSNLKFLIRKILFTKNVNKKTKFNNLYFKKNTVSKIYQIIKKQNLKKILIKKFYEKR